jgi:hypothetical protein
VRIFGELSCLAETLIFLSGGLQASLPSGAVFSFDNRAKASLHESGNIRLYQKIHQNGGEGGIRRYLINSVLRIRIREPGSGAFVIPEFGSLIPNLYF